MRSALVDDVAQALGAPEQPLELVRRAFAVDRVSLARIDLRERRFEIAAEAGAELLGPGTALPLSTCSYFAQVAEGEAFHDEDFDRSRSFDRPVDSVVLATGFHSGCSVPVRHRGEVVGAISLSDSQRSEAMAAFVAELEPLADLLAAKVAERVEQAMEVLVCHGDPLASRGIAGLLEAHGGVRATVAGTLAAAREAASACPPDVLVCDDRLDGRRIDAVARALQRAGVDAPLLVVSSRDTPAAVRVALAAGAVAHIARRDAVRELPAALDALRRGEPLPRPQPSPAGAGLTAREHELLECLEEGLRFKQIARRLQISEATAKTHARNLFRKLDATSRAEAVHAARGRGLLS